ncbi:hypothetical protein HanXRQr2_Chr05g0225961 [Helianthus annuus]|uniref:Uncharacterized protein n=1 Tax=Helianthus annuus TaxID=4232 RepID=A0A9K3NP47_HELAN|nr:hypothetical protein HanXRQr2_Chr05g0225961 [Helianthus annuus]
MKKNDDQIEGEHRFLRNPNGFAGLFLFLFPILFQFLFSYCSRTCQYIDLVFYITCKL